MRKFTYNIGDQFGYWTIIDNTSVVKYGHTYVKVKCKCGKEEWKCLSDLRSGRTTGCRNCKARERSIPIKIGDKYKSWTVIDGPKIADSWGGMLWLAKCDCGTERWITPHELVAKDKCFSCQHCSGKRTSDTLKQKNGIVGELDMNKYGRIKRVAERRKIPFEVSMKYLWDLYLLQSKKCAITGDPIPNIKKASLDRIDSSKGYVEGNVQWVTYQANVSKHIMSMEELYIFCRKVLNHANQQPSQSLTTLEGSETNSWNSNREYNTNTSAEHLE